MLKKKKLLTVKFPEIRGNKKKPWTHSTPLNSIVCLFVHLVQAIYKSNNCLYAIITMSLDYFVTVVQEYIISNIGFPSQFNVNSIQIDFQIIQFRANLYAHLKVYFNLQIRRFNFNNCSSDSVHQSFNLIKQAFNRQKGSIIFIKSARN